MGKTVKRLFNEFHPIKYSLDIIPSREDMLFTGKVIIRGMKIGRPSKRITLHQKGLQIISAKVIKHNKHSDQEIKLKRINVHKRFDELRIHTENIISPGTYTITLEFTGKITRNMDGIYPCYFNDKNQQQILIATQFESHHAREVFPCIDEPEAKATFDLTLTTPKDETVLANTPIKHQKVKGNDITTSFETTPKMSTYLLAFVFGKLEYLEAKTNNGIRVRTYATPNNVEFTSFALDVAVKALEYYNEYFDFNYPLEKCDMVALPDFASGAMENWGLITYREQAFLVDPKNTSLATKQYVAMVVAHELAHQWFGNLVTMRWWTDLWLNEGFASWIEYLAVDHIFPEWQMWTQFAVDEQQRAFKLDALDNTHPVEVPIQHPDEIRSIFDTISYSKGASVINMLYNYLTPEVFRDGLRHYLSLHKWSNTDTVDLWNALENISGKPVRDFMHAWVRQSGFPLLTAETSDTKAHLTQERFYANPEQKTRTDQVWPIALLSDEEGMPELFNKQSLELDIIDIPSLKFNRGQSGFYRTIYNPRHLERLGTLVKDNQLTPLDRLGVLSDLFESAKAGKLPTVNALKFLSFFTDESNNAVWDVIASGVISIRQVMDDEQLRESMKPYIRRLVDKQLNRLGWDYKPHESHFDQLLRPTIISMAAGADTETVVSECLKRFNSMNKPEDIHPDLRGAIYNTIARINNDEPTFKELFRIHETTTNSEERNTIASALCSFKSPKLYRCALDLITSDSVRHQDVSYWVIYSFSNRHAKYDTWKWMKDNWKWLSGSLGTDLSFYRFPLYAAGAFSDYEFLKDYDDFFLSRKEPAFERSIKQGREVIIWQSAWKKRDLKAIKSFFLTKS